MRDTDLIRTSQGNLSIGTVAKLTGISVHTLRAWEKRYQVVSVRRSDTGRRLYSKDDVHRLRLLRKLTQAGHSIGNVAYLGDYQLEEMLDLEFDGTADNNGEKQLDICLYSEKLLDAPALSGTILKKVNVVIETNELGVLKETVSGKGVYAVVFMFNTILKQQLRMLRQMIESERRHKYFIVFTFAQREMIDELKSLGFNLLRAPISYEHLFEKVLNTFHPEEKTRKNNSGSEEPPFAEVPPHKFTKKQLEALTNTRFAIDCEYPNHIANLVHQLTLYEAHSQNCASKNNDAAHLHNNIYKLTAQARDMMERAISLVVEAENINLEYMSIEK